EVIKKPLPRMNQKKEENHKEEKEEYYFAKEGKKDKRIVFIAIKVKRFSDVDNVKEQYRCRFHYYLTWLLTYPEYIDYLEYLHAHNLSKWRPAFLPDIEFVNAVEGFDICICIYCIY
ncbi:hypothetical protein RFI_34639, partial [Reticulomyxa filosa]